MSYMQKRVFLGMKMNSNTKKSEIIVITLENLEDLLIVFAI